MDIPSLRNSIYGHTFVESLSLRLYSVNDLSSQLRMPNRLKVFSDLVHLNNNGKLVFILPVHTLIIL